jgi:hypothetical protein
METLHRRCAGLDVHQKEIVACRRLVSGQKARSELARFPTTTRGLVDLSTWLSEAKVTHVAMEATGVYWKPVCGVRPCGWTTSSCRFDPVLGVLVLELHRAEIAEC